MTKVKTGKLTEEIAREYLERKGYQFISSNQYFPNGEVDLIMKDNEFIVFIEVKSLKIYSEFSIYESVTKKKKRRIRKTIDDWLFKNKKQSEVWRVDFVGVLLDNKSNVQKIEHFEFIEL